MSENMLKYPVCGGGRIWGTNEPVPDAIAAQMDRAHFESVSDTIDEAVAAATITGGDTIDGGGVSVGGGTITGDDTITGGGEGGEGGAVEEWYDSSTVATVLDGVNGDPVRAQFAIARELERPKPRDGVVTPLTALIGG